MPAPSNNSIGRTLHAEMMLSSPVRGRGCNPGAYHQHHIQQLRLGRVPSILAVNSISNLLRFALIDSSREPRSRVPAASIHNSEPHEYGHRCC